MEDFILQVPKWQGEMRFDYEFISFVLIWVVLGASLLLCVWGYKYFRSMFLLVLGSLCGVLGIFIANVMTDNPVLKMFFFIMFVFFGMCFFYFASIVVVWLLKRFRLDATMCKLECWLAALLGSSLVGITVYKKIFHNIWIVAGAALILFIYSAWHGQKNVHKRRAFYTYEDLRKMTPVTEVPAGD